MRELLERVLVDGSPLTCPPDPADDLLPAERFGDTAALDDGEHRLLDRRETPAARRARSPAARGVAVVDLPGVDDPTVRVAAERAAHRHPPPSAEPHLLTNDTSVTTTCRGRGSRTPLSVPACRPNGTSVTTPPRHRRTASTRRHPQHLSGVQRHRTERVVGDDPFRDRRELRPRRTRRNPPCDIPRAALRTDRDDHRSLRRSARLPG